MGFFLCINVEILHQCGDSHMLHVHVFMQKLSFRLCLWSISHGRFYRTMEASKEGLMDEKRRSNSAVRGVIIASVLGAVYSWTWTVSGNDTAAACIHVCVSSTVRFGGWVRKMTSVSVL